LEGCRIEVEERLARQVERGLPGDRPGIFGVGPQAPAGAVDMFAPALLEANPAIELAGAKPGETIEGDLLACAMLHEGEGARRILRVVGVSGRQGHDLVEPVAEEAVDLELVEAVAVIARRNRCLPRHAPALSTC